MCGRGVVGAGRNGTAAGATTNVLLYSAAPAPPPPAPYPVPYGAPQQPGYPYGPPPQYPAHAAAPRSRVPGWLWPLIAVVSLVVGILGGAIGGALVADYNKDDAGVLQVERRTAEPHGRR